MASLEVEERLEKLPRTAYLLWAAVGLCIVFIVPGAFIWNALQLSWSRCFYADPACSLTFATYVLCLITLGAFLAAFGAARYAAEALAHEQRAALAVQPCHKKHGKNHRPDVTLYFATDSGRELTETRPDSSSFDKKTWKRVCFMALGVGRAPLIDVVLTAAAFMPDGDNPEGTAHIGSLRPDGRAHIRFWLPPSDASTAKIGWVDAQHNGGKKLKHFFPERSRKQPEYVKQVDFTQTYAPVADGQPEAPVGQYDVPEKPARRNLLDRLFGRRK